MAEALLERLAPTVGRQHEHIRIGLQPWLETRQVLLRGLLRAHLEVGQMHVNERCTRRHAGEPLIPDLGEGQSVRAGCVRDAWSAQPQ